MNASAPTEIIETQLSRDGPIAVLTINNVARRNALSVPVKQDMIRHLRDLHRDPTCRAIVLTGAGGFFSAGGDVKTMSARGERDSTTPGMIDRRLGLTDFVK